MNEETLKIDVENLTKTYIMEVKLWCFNKDKSLRELCNMAGVKYHTVWNCFDKNIAPSQLVVYAIYKVTNIRFL